MYADTTIIDNFYNNFYYKSCYDSRNKPFKFDEQWHPDNFVNKHPFIFTDS